MTNYNIEELMLEIGKRAKNASSIIANSTSKQKEEVIMEAAAQIINAKDTILQANTKDIEQAIEKGISNAMLDRLKLDEKRIISIANGLKEIALLTDPIGKTINSWTRPNGLMISQVSVPIGVIGIIYEARPNVTADAAAIALKAGNVTILRGGSESYNSSLAIVSCLHKALEKFNLPLDAIQLIPTSDRRAVSIMLRMSDYIDLIIPRGGKGLCSLVKEESRVPTLLHLDGNCHTYIHKNADFKKAVKIIHNAKLRRTGICGATESLLIDQSIAKEILPSIVETLSSGGCQIRGDQQAMDIDNKIIPATEEDWYTEYLDSIISIKIIRDLDEAINFINKYGSHHTDAIITENSSAAEKFFKLVDSSIVMQNTSTQFADGGEFGMGAEIGISTGRLHARGPVGAQQLTTYKYIVSSDGAIRAI